MIQIIFGPHFSLDRWETSSYEVGMFSQCHGSLRNPKSNKQKWCVSLIEVHSGEAHDQSLASWGNFASHLDCFRNASLKQYGILRINSRTHIKASRDPLISYAGLEGHTCSTTRSHVDTSRE